jgi:hypothetical protein
MPDEISKAAAILGRKGGKARGKTKARTGISERMKAWWASPAAAKRRKKTKTKSNHGKENQTQRRSEPQPPNPYAGL